VTVLAWLGELTATSDLALNDTSSIAKQVTNNWTVLILEGTSKVPNLSHELLEEFDLKLDSRNWEAI
jgi:hypothetical protein